jgi:hypothetical protein
MNREENLERDLDMGVAVFIIFFCGKFIKTGLMSLSG